MSETPTLTKLKGWVKAVNSADTVVIRDAPRGGPPKERIFSFSNVSAPRLARRPQGEDKDNKDEPFAWQSREFLRKKVIGKEVTYQVEYTTTNGRMFGTLFLNNDGVEENITKTLVSEGWVRIREGTRASPELEELSALAATATDAGRGVHAKNTDNAIRNIQWNVENPRILIDAAKGKPVAAVVEQVRDASTLRVFILPTFEYVTVMITGIKAPGFKREGDKDVPEPFADEAKYFTEVGVLNQDVELVLEGSSNQNLLATVLVRGANLGEKLVSEGFAKVVDWSIGQVTVGRDKLRAAEKVAKGKRARLWKNYVPPADVLSSSVKNFSGQVSEISNGESIVVLQEDQVPRKIFFSSLRQPQAKKVDGAPDAEKKDGAAQKGPRVNPQDVPFLFDAREFLRKKLIGEQVKVVIDYIRPANDGFPERIYASVFLQEVNIGEALVSKGLATVVRHRENDEQRSAHYDDLLAAEDKAKKSNKGVHDPKSAETGVHKFVEINNKAIADRYLPSFKRSSKVSGVVDYVLSGSRIKVFVPKENCFVMLNFGGISCPRPARGQEPAEPLSQEALEYTRSRLFQHDIDFEVEDVDKTGSFIGFAFLKSTNIAVGLVEAGFAKLHFSAEKSRYGSNLAAAEKAAKDAKRGIWLNYVEPTADAVDTSSSSDKGAKKKAQSTVVVTELTAVPITFFAQATDGGLSELMANLALAMANPPLAGSFTPKKGELVACQFAADKQWYRAKILKLVDKSAEIIYVDFGNSETVSFTKLAPLPAGLSALPHQAREYTLAFASEPRPEWTGEVAQFMEQNVLNGQFVCTVEYNDSGRDYVSLVDKETQANVAVSLIENGILLTKKPKFAKDAFAPYLAAEEKARSSRKNMWMYGDCREDE